MYTPERLAMKGTEHGEQAAVFCWAAKATWQGFAAANTLLAYTVAPKEFSGVPVVPDLRWLHAIPNGGGRSAKQGADLKAEGVKGGVADICLPVPCGQYHGLYIEMKKANGVPSDVSKDQYDFGRFVTQRGYLWIVCFGWKQAVSIIQKYVENTPVQASDLSKHQLTVLTKVREQQ